MKAGGKLILVLAACSSACASFSTRTTAQPTPKGAIELGVDVDAFAAEGRDTAAGPGIEITFRYGLTEAIDIGAKLNVLGLELSSKISLIDDYFFDLAVLPAIGFQLGAFNEFDTEVFIGTFGVPVLVGFNLFDWVNFVFGAKPFMHASAGRGTNDGSVILYPGLVVGFKLRLVKNFAVFPEINLHFPYNTELKRWRELVWQGGIAFQLTFGD